MSLTVTVMQFFHQFDLQDFGSCIMAPDSGVILHNRGLSFRVDPDHPNRIEPVQRPMHTIIPGMAMKDGKVVLPCRCDGWSLSIHGAYVFANEHVLLGMDPQANEAPRHFCFDGELHQPRISEDAARTCGRVAITLERHRRTVVARQSILTTKTVFSLVVPIHGS